MIYNTLYKQYIYNKLTSNEKNKYKINISDKDLLNGKFIKSYEEIREKRKNNFAQEYKIDILNLETYDIIKCINKEVITLEDISICLLQQLKYNKQITIYHTGIINDNIQNIPNITFIYCEHKKENINKNNINKNEIIKKYKDFYKNDNKSILILPKGLGRKEISYEISKEYKMIIYITHSIEEMYKIKEWNETYDNTRSNLIIDNKIEEKDINEFILLTEKQLLICMPKTINKIEDKMEDCFIILEDYQYLNKLFDTTESICRILNNNYKILSISNVTDLKNIGNKKKIGILEKIFGKILFKLSIDESIKLGYFNNYKIEYINTKINDYQMIHKIFKDIEEEGNNNILIYTDNHKKENEIKEYIQKENEIYYYNYNIERYNDKIKENIIKIIKRNDNIKENYAHIYILNNKYEEIDIINDLIKDSNNLKITLIKQEEEKDTELEKWHEKKEEFKKYIQEHKELPLRTSKLYNWYKSQEYNYSIKSKRHKDENIRNEWKEIKDEYLKIKKCK